VATAAADIKIVEDFIGAWNRRDVDRIAAFLAADVVYHNIPMATVSGRDRVMAGLAPFIRSWKLIDWRLLHIAAAGDGVVLTERVDVFEGDDRRLSVRVMGAFEIAGGEILAWRDYFDPQELERPGTPQET
jgi:limonene-1,2-epoxide hydrolase